MPPKNTQARTVCAIPARFASTRLPGKPLLPLAGRPMICHVVERAAAAPGIDRVVVLTDDRRIAEAVASEGGAAEMTPAELPSGTDRIAWAARGWDDVDVVINLQGDEPLVDSSAVGRLARHMEAHPDERMATLATEASPHELDDPNAVKVVTGTSGHALYFSRSRIPYPRNPEAPAATAMGARKHVGVYAYRRDTLIELAGLPPSPLEEAESLEQLRALEAGIPIRVLPGGRPAPGVDTAEDLARVEALMASGTISNDDTERTT